MAREMIKSDAPQAYKPSLVWLLAPVWFAVGSLPALYCLYGFGQNLDEYRSIGGAYLLTGLGAECLLLLLNHVVHVREKRRESRHMSKADEVL